MDVKDLTDTLKSRLNGPVFFPFLFAFVAVNWKALLFLAFHDGTIQERVAGFESHVSLWSMLFWPAFIGFALICLIPYPRWLISSITGKAVRGKARMDARTLQATENAVLDGQMETNEKRLKITQQEQKTRA
ncbi:MAG: hypothetical protein OXC91_15360 [Rhodobacteraceae bacterium]|nr:hypothetical protein [Paracoccaceae bacterium]